MYQFPLLKRLSAMGLLVIAGSHSVLAMDVYPEQDDSQAQASAAPGVEARVEAMAQDQFDLPAKDLPNEILAVIFVQLSSQELIHASRVNKNWHEIAVRVMGDSLRKWGVNPDLYPASPAIVHYFSIIARHPDKNFVGIVMSKEPSRMGSLRLVVYVLKSNNPTVKSGQELVLLTPARRQYAYIGNVSAEALEQRFAELAKGEDPKNTRQIKLGQAIYFNEVKEGKIDPKQAGLVFE